MIKVMKRGEITTLGGCAFSLPRRLAKGYLSHKVGAEKLLNYIPCIKEQLVRHLYTDEHHLFTVKKAKLRSCFPKCVVSFSQSLSATCQS